MIGYIRAAFTGSRGCTTKAASWHCRRSAAGSQSWRTTPSRSGRDGDRAADLGPGARVGGAEAPASYLFRGGVLCLWQRRERTAMKHRLKAPEAKAAQD